MLTAVQADELAVSVQRVRTAYVQGYQREQPDNWMWCAEMLALDEILANLYSKVRRWESKAMETHQPVKVTQKSMTRAEWQALALVLELHDWQDGQLPQSLMMGLQNPPILPNLPKLNG